MRDDLAAVGHVQGARAAPQQRIGRAAERQIVNLGLGQDIADQKQRMQKRLDVFHRRAFRQGHKRLPGRVGPRGEKLGDSFFVAGLQRRLAAAALGPFPGPRGKLQTAGEMLGARSCLGKRPRQNRIVRRGRGQGPGGRRRFPGMNDEEIFPPGIEINLPAERQLNRPPLPRLDKNLRRRRAVDLGLPNLGAQQPAVRLRQIDDRPAEMLIPRAKFHRGQMPAEDRGEHPRGIQRRKVDHGGRFLGENGRRNDRQRGGRAETKNTQRFHTILSFLGKAASLAEALLFLDQDNLMNRDRIDG